MSRDDADVKETDLEWHQELHLLRAVMSATQTGIYLKSQTGQYLYGNARGASLLGTDAGSLVGKSDVDLFGQEVANAIHIQDRNIIESGIAHSEERTVTSAHGDQQFLITKSLFQDAQGVAIGILGVIRELTTPVPTEDALRRHLFELMLLNQVGSVCSSVSSIDDILAQTTCLIAEALYPDNCGFLTLDETREVLVPHASFVLSDPSVPSVDIPLTTGLTGKTARTGRPWRIDDVASDSDYLAADARTRSEMCVPLRSGGHVIGVMNIESSVPRAFSEADERLIVAVLDLVGAATERLRAEQALRNSERRFALFMKHFPGMAWIKDSQGRYVYVNDAALTIFQKSAQQIYGKTDHEIFSPKIAGQFQVADQLVLTQGRGIQTFETLEHADGVLHYSLVSRFPLPGNGTMNPLVGGMASDVTEQMEAQREVQEKQNFLHSIAEATPHWIYIFDLDEMGVTYTNRSLLRDLGHLAGAEQAERSLQAFADYMPPDELPHLARLLVEWPTLADGQLRDDEYRLLHADGTIHSFSSREIVFARRPDGTVKQILGTLSDVTAHRLAEADALTSQKFVKAVAESSPLTIYVFNVLQRRIIYSNNYILRDLGYSPEMVQGWNWNEVGSLVHPEDMANVSSLLERWNTAEDGQILQAEYRLKDASGQWHWFISRDTIFQRDADGRVSQIVGTAEDITYRKQADEALRISEGRLRQLADAIPQIVWVAGPDGGLTHLNAKATEYTGVGMDQLTGWSWEQVIFPDDLAETLDIWTECLRDGISRDMSFRIRRTDGAYRWHINRQVPVRDADGTIALWYGTCTDIEDLKRAEQSLRDGEARFRLLFEGAADAIFWADAETGLLTNCNHAAEVLLGRARTEIIGQLQSFLHPPEEADRYREMFRAHATEQSTTALELEVLRKDGRRVDVSISPSVTLINGRRVIQGIFRDISDRKRAEARALKSAEFQETMIRTAAEGICVCFPVPEFPFVGFSVWNDRMIELTGYTLDEINRLGWYQSLYPDSEVRARAQARMDQMRTGNDLRGEMWEIVRKDGIARTVTISTSRVEIEGGMTGVVGMIQDVTERKRAEESLQLMRFCVDHAGESMFWVDRHGKILYVNDTACRERGYSREELLSMAIFDLDPDYQADTWKQHFDELKDRGTITLETRHRAKDGRLIPIEVNANYVHIGDQEFNFASVRNIAERKQREQRLAQLAAIVESSSDAIFGTTLTGEITSWNRGAEKVFGYPEAEIVGRSVATLIPADRAPEMPQVLGQIRQGQAIDLLESVACDKDGRQIDVELAISPVRDAEGQLVGASTIARDISVYKRSEAERQRWVEELRLSEERFSKLFHASPFSIIVATYPEGEILEANRAFLRLFGFERQEVIGKTTGDLDIWVDPEQRNYMIKALRERNSARDMEIAFRTKSGELLTLLMSVEIIRLQGQPFSLAMSIDLTERKEAERMLRLNQFSIDRAVDSIFWIASSSEILYVNDAACRTLGYTREEMVGKTVPDIDPNFPPEAWPAHWDELQRRKSFTFESDHATKDGRVLKTEVTVNYLQYEGREYNCAVMRDITDRKRTEQEIRQSLSRLQATLESTADGILVVDLKGRIIDLNQQFLLLWNLPADMVSEGRKTDLIAKVNSHRAVQEMLRQLKDPKEFAKRVAEIYRVPEESSFDVIEFQDGRVLERQSRPQRVDGIPVGRVWSFRDVSERKRLEDQLRQSQKMEAVGQLAGGIAHDFNNLLTVINGYCDLLLAKKSKGNSWIESVQEIREAGGRAARLTEQLLAFSRRSQFQPRVVDLNAIIEGSEKLLRRLIGEQIELRVQLDSRIPSIRADVNQLEQVLMNLVVNARDAMPTGGQLTIRTQRLSPQEPNEFGVANSLTGTYVQMEITDTGMGMSEEVQARIFEPFFTTKETGKGSGLGLSVVHGIMQQHEGRIHVTTQWGQGTTFQLLFPGVAESPTAQTPSVKMTFHHGAETILLVEDEPGVRKMTRLLLEQHGYQVLEAASGQAAFDLLPTLAQPIDLLLTDIVMPGIGGRELADALKAVYHGLQVIYISGYHEDSRVRDESLRPYEGFLKKPFTQEELLHQIRVMMDADIP